MIARCGPWAVCEGIWCGSPDNLWRRAPSAPRNRYPASAKLCGGRHVDHHVVVRPRRAACRTRLSHYLDPPRDSEDFMPLERSVKSDLRDKVSTANKSNVDGIIALVEAARGGLAEDDADFVRLGGWLDDLAVVKSGSVPGRFGDTV